MSDEQATPAPEKPSSSKPLSERANTLIGCAVMLVIGAVILVKCVGGGSKSPPPVETAAPASEKSQSELARAVLLAEMRRESSMIWREKAQEMRYGASEQWALALFGTPARESRDGQGGHLYVWAGSGVALFAKFNNGKCSFYQILDEEDVKVMDFD